MELWILWAVIGVRIVTYDIFFKVFLKGIATATDDEQLMARRLFGQFFMAALLSTIIAILCGQLQLSWWIVAIMIVGFFNGFGAYNQWKAMQFSLSAMAIFTFWDDIIAISLAMFGLDEKAYMTRGLSLAFAGCVVSIIVFIANNHFKSRKAKGTQYIPGKFFVHVFAYTFIWGIAWYCNAHFAKHGIPKATFLFAWYFGATLAACLIPWHVIVWFKPKRGRDSRQSISSIYKLSRYITLIRNPEARHAYLRQLKLILTELKDGFIIRRKGISGIRATMKSDVYYLEIKPNEHFYKVVGKGQSSAGAGYKKADQFRHRLLGKSGDISEILKGNLFLLSMLLAPIAMLGMWLTYWAIQLAPLVLVKTVFYIATTVFTALVGMFVFREWKNYNLLDRVLFLVMIVMAVLMGVNYQPLESLLQ
jgi:hypothetical protein